MSGQFIILPLSRIDYLTVSKIGHPFNMKPFWLVEVSHSMTDSNHINLQVIFPSTLTNEIGLQFFKKSNRVINACFCELDNSPF